MSDEPGMEEPVELGGPLGEPQQGVPLTGKALDDYWAKEEARLGYPPKRPTAAENQRLADELEAAAKRAGSRWV